MKKTIRHHQKGSALVYILIAIALLAALTATFMDSSSQQTTSQNIFNTVTQLKSQINLIRSSIQECVLVYPGGDSGADGNSGLRNPPTAHFPYPINPSSTYLASPAVNDKVMYIKCPGNPGNSNDHQPIFGGSSGKFLPPPPNLFGDWIYYSGADGVFFYTATSKTDAFLTSAMTKLDDQFAECEADVVDNSGNVAALNMTLAGPPTCDASSWCFRVWVIATDPQYVGDTDTDEAACP